MSAVVCGSSTMSGWRFAASPTATSAQADSSVRGGPVRSRTLAWASCRRVPNDALRSRMASSSEAMRVISRSCAVSCWAMIRAASASAEGRVAGCGLS